ncbi:MAG: DUF4166 domain-containing protein [Pseudomonadota bacterium]
MHNPSAAPAPFRVVVIGGTGVFGSRLARRLSADPRFDVVVASRSLAQCQKHCVKYGGRAVVLYTDAPGLETALAALEPDCIVDAAGPFQLYDGDGAYRVAKAAIACRAHYIDFSDAIPFTLGITALDGAARAAGVAVISGCSTVPAISAAALDELTRDLRDVRLVRSLLTPGNRAPRGLSVIRAILAQAGRPFRVWRGGGFRRERAWARLRRETFTRHGNAPSLGRRWGSPIGAPDLELFPSRYRAESVRFDAGLELTVMHLGLWALTFPVRWGWLRSLTTLARPLKWAATLLYPLGSDRGGMRVEAIGTRAGGDLVRRRWDVIATGGVGPEIPAVPAFVLCEKLARGATDKGCVGVGAAPAVGVLTLDEMDPSFAHFGITTVQTGEPFRRAFEQALGASASTLPASVRALHDVVDLAVWRGTARSERGTSPVARAIAWVFGLPPSSEAVDVTVEMERVGDSEVWTRTFDQSRFRSTLTPARDGDGDGRMTERFGALHFQLRLRVDDGRLYYDVEGGKLFGLVPLPLFLTPRSETHEFVHDDGAPGFSVRVTLPVGGLLFAYHGRLTQDRAEKDAPAPANGIAAGSGGEHERPIAVSHRAAADNAGG